MANNSPSGCIQLKLFVNVWRKCREISLLILIGQLIMNSVSAEIEPKFLDETCLREFKWYWEKYCIQCNLKIIGGNKSPMKSEESRKFSIVECREEWEGWLHGYKQRRGEGWWKEECKLVRSRGTFMRGRWWHEGSE